MPSSQAGLWSDGNPSGLGMVRLRYYGTRDGRKRALGVISIYTLRFLMFTLTIGLDESHQFECWNVSMTVYGVDRCDDDTVHTACRTTQGRHGR